MQELASLGNFGDNYQNIYERMVANRSSSTYVVDAPVVVTKVSSRDLRLSFCHIGAEKFWEEHDLLDPKLGNPPAMEGGNVPSKFLPVVLCGDGAQA